VFEPTLNSNACRPFLLDPREELIDAISRHFVCLGALVRKADLRTQLS
jgi:hypothetical protein